MENEHNTILYMAFLNCAFVLCVCMCASKHIKEKEKNREGEITNCFNTPMAES